VRLAALLLLAGCASAPPPQELSVWWAPLASYDARHISPDELSARLAEKGIQTLIHTGSQGVSVAFERHAEALADLKAAPFVAQLRFHGIQGGPRPDARLQKTPPDASRTNWIEAARFRAGSVDAEALLELLRKSQSEPAIVTYGTDPAWSSVLVPAQHAVRARQSLRANAAWRKSVEILW